LPRPGGQAGMPPFCQASCRLKDQEKMNPFRGSKGRSLSKSILDAPCECMGFFIRALQRISAKEFLVVDRFFCQVLDSDAGFDNA